MSDWTAGYMADIDYTYGYYFELNPLHVKQALLNAGQTCPEFGAACELGFGQGISTNLHAAASVTHWYGTDFNPSQAAFAQELAAASGAPVEHYDEAFADFATRKDLPDFDFIGLHGIWSWISDENRSVIVDFIRRKLKVGGVVYMSYNTQPGWAAMAPLRDLLNQHADVLGAEGSGIVSRVEGAISFTDKLLSSDTMFVRANPHVLERFNKLKGQPRQYVAHEYFNRHWQPMSFAKVAELLAAAKIQWACSAGKLDTIDPINLKPEHQALLKEIPDEMFRQSVRDFCVNQQFRRDYWVKGGRKLSALEQAEQVRKQRFILARARDEVPMKVSANLGEVSLTPAIYEPILDVLADHKPRTFAQLEQAVHGKNINFLQLQQALMVLGSNASIVPAQEDSQIAKVKKQTQQLNTCLMLKSRSSADLNFLGSPVTGGGVPIQRIQQLFLLARQNGHKQPQDWAQFVLQLLAAQGQRVAKEGKQLESLDDNLQELTVMARTFASRHLPVLEALQVA